MLIRWPLRPTHEFRRRPVEGSQAFTLRWLALNRVLPSTLYRIANTQSV
jgi:hypothetical protein